MTRRLYQTDPDLVRCQALVEQVTWDDRGLWLGLRQTVFHPQGGGQPSDAGWLRVSADTAYPLLAAVWSPDGSGLIRHYVDDAAIAEVVQDGEVELELALEPRLLHSRLHSAGHLLAAICEELVPAVQATKGHHFPRASYIECSGPRPALDELTQRQDEIAARASAAIASDRAVAAEQKGPELRLVAIDGYAPVGCGGTHVPRLGVIGGVQITGMRIKSSRLRLSYALDDAAH